MISVPLVEIFDQIGIRYIFYDFSELGLPQYPNACALFKTEPAGALERGQGCQMGLATWGEQGSKCLEPTPGSLWEEWPP